jgi:hypothetical protein
MRADTSDMGTLHLRLLACATLSLSSALAGCNGGAAALLGCPSTRTANNGVPELLYPESDARNVPDSLSAVVIAFDGTASEVDTLALGGPNGSSVAIGPVKAAPSPAPSPMSPAPAGWSVYSVPVPQLAAHTQYTLRYTYGSSYNSCNGQQTTTASVGQFTTR